MIHFHTFYLVLHDSFRIGIVQFQEAVHSRNLYQSQPKREKFLALLHIRKVFQKNGGGILRGSVRNYARPPNVFAPPYLYRPMHILYPIFESLALSTWRKPVTGEELPVAVLINLSRRTPAPDWISLIIT
ncbi:hypothetical protein CDAR_110151 [Caerostris darwini]|uniref:Uncharacterized protein n=1 Tax=Caerostris darwini TaxID=1538125 RepID=A0AAV4S4K3_9ARAC|nr:hypothetical protein CDAR_110151 [Caerostris darwini]